MFLKKYKFAHRVQVSISRFFSNTLKSLHFPVPKNELWCLEKVLSRRSDSRAFTLIEVLIALVIFSIIMWMAAFSFRFSLKIVKYLTTPSLEELENISKLKDSLNSLFFFLSENDRTFDIKERFYFFFSGNSNKLTFITTKPIFSSGKRLYIVELKFNNDRLELREYPLYDRLVDYKNPSIPENVQPKILISRIKDCLFKYFKDGRWLATIKNEIPRLVKISYENEKGEKKFLISRVQSDFYFKKDFCTYIYKPF